MLRRGSVLQRGSVLRRGMALFVVGSVGGAVCDQIHVQAGVLRYAHPSWLDQAWWVGPQFGLAAIAIVAMARPFAPPTPTGPTASVVGPHAAWFIAAYGASGLFHAHPGALATVYALAWVARLLPRPDGRLGRRDAGDRVRAAGFAVLLALVGCAYEGTLSATGAFRYLHPDLYHVPVWLPGLYLHGAPLALDLARALPTPSVSPD